MDTQFRGTSWLVSEQLWGGSAHRQGPAHPVLPVSVCALHTGVCICISGLLVPGLPTRQHRGGVLGEEGHHVAALWGQPWIQR